MKMREALKKAREIIDGQCRVTGHYGADRRADRAVRLSGCMQADAVSWGREIAAAIGGTLRSDAGIVLVWL